MKPLSQAFFISVFLFSYLDSYSQVTQDSSTQKHYPAMSDAELQGDQQFISDAITANAGEIELAKLGEEKSSNKELRAIAATLRTDHSAMLNSLRNLANRRSLNVPALDTTQLIKDNNT